MVIEIPSTEAPVVNHTQSWWKTFLPRTFEALIIFNELNFNHFHKLPMKSALITTQLSCLPIKTQFSQNSQPIISSINFTFYVCDSLEKKKALNFIFNTVNDFSNFPQCTWMRIKIKITQVYENRKRIFFRVLWVGVSGGWRKTASVLRRFWFFSCFYYSPRSCHPSANPPSLGCDDYTSFWRKARSSKIKT